MNLRKDHKRYFQYQGIPLRLLNKLRLARVATRTVNARDQHGESDWNGILRMCILLFSAAIVLSDR